MTATSASAVEGDAGSGTTAVDAPVTPGTDSTATDAPTAPATDEPTAPTTTPADESTDEPTAPASTAPAAPATTAPKPTRGVTTKAALAAAGTVHIDGDAKVGVTLHARTTGFAGPHTYAWTRDDAPTVVLSADETYAVTTADVDHVLTLTVTDTGSEVATSASTATVSEDVAFADADTNSIDAPVTITTDAGVAYSHSFAVSEGSGTVTYSIGYSTPEDHDATDPDDTPESYLPDGVEFNTATGVLSGTSIYASDYDFTVVATNGTSTATEYVEITVNPGVSVGVLAFATDTSSEDFFNGTKPSTFWIITPDGAITTVHQPADYNEDPTFEDGGQPTVKQGQSLWVQGNAVDQYGNDTQGYDEETGESPRPVVTSDVASDQIAWDDDESATKVTFPHASTHHLTVAQEDVSVSFAVTVVPTPATTTVTTVATGPTGRQLAYTGSDATGALPWALALVLAGAGLIGARTVRRRRAQR
jgi:hypothetical protein